MTNKNSFTKFAILAFVLFAAVSPAFTQKLQREEKLLNGMNLLVRQDAAAQKATVKLRVHSGAAFDPLGKEGTMALLADTLFPTDAAKEYFTEDLGGSLEVVSSYDYIQINATADNDKLLEMLETIATAVTNPQIDKDTTAKVRAARVEAVKESEKSASYVADQAVAKRLFGDFPYGRAQAGTSRSLAKIDFADLLLAKQKFLPADNTTLVVAGNVKPDLVARAVRRYFGSWQKADKKVPATFRQPDAPDAKQLTVESLDAGKGLRRYAWAVAARGNADFYATKILTEIWRKEFCFGDDSKRGKSSFEPHLLGGIYTISQNQDYELPATGRNPCAFLLVQDGKIVFPAITQADFEQAKSKIVSELNEKTQSSDDLANLWLDVATYDLASVKDEMRKADGVTLADVQRVAENLRKQTFANVLVEKPSESK